MVKKLDRVVGDSNLSDNYIDVSVREEDEGPGGV